MATISPGRSHAHPARLLAPHKTPRRWHLVEGFPLTGSGKIQNFVLRDCLG